jgi:ribosomal protein L7/L12
MKSMSSVYQNESQNGVTVSYPAREETQTISKADYYAIRCMGKDNKIQAIKFIRMQTGLGLYESKQIVDTVMAHPDVLPTWAAPADQQQHTSLGALLRSKLDSAGYGDDD